MSTPLPTVGTAKRISTLEPARAIDGTELVPIVQDDTTRGATADAIGGHTPSCTTAGRPALTMAHTGYNVFDVTLGKPLWWTGAGWVDATGAAA